MRIIEKFKLFINPKPSKPFLRRAVFADRYENSFWTIGIGLLMGTLIICSIIWNRLIRERLPREIPGEIEVYSFSFWIILISFLSCLVGLWHYLKDVLIALKLKEFKTPKILIAFDNFFEKRPKSRQILNDTSDYYKYYILEAPLYLWRFVYFNCRSGIMAAILQKLQILYNFAWYLAETVFNRDEVPNHKLRMLLTTIILLYIPRIIAFTIFSIEVLIYKKLEYFYYFSWILLIPVIFVCVRRILADISRYQVEDNIMEDRKILRVLSKTVIEEDDGLLIYRIETTQYSTEISEEEYWVERHTLIECTEIGYMVGRLFLIDEKYKKYVNLYYTILFTISFGGWLLMILKIC